MIAGLTDTNGNMFALDDKIRKDKRIKAGTPCLTVRGSGFMNIKRLPVKGSTKGVVGISRYPWGYPGYKTDLR